MVCGHANSSKESYCVRRVPIFANLTDSEIPTIQNAIWTRRYKKGELVFREGERSETLYIINQGVVKISKLSPSGKEQIIRFLFPGDFFGQFALLQGKRHYANAEALDATSVCLIDKTDFKAILEHNPDMTYRFLLAISEKLQQADEWMGTISLLEVEQRLAKILLLFYRKNQSGENSLQLPVAKKELAALIGTTPETLSRKLSYFESLHILALDSRKNIRVLSPAVLSQIAEG